MPHFLRLFVLLGFLTAHAPGAFADMSEALTAYARGDYEQAAELATQSASLGVREANRLLGEMRENGQGLAQNDALAWAHYFKAAMSGDAESQYRLGQMFENGRGVPQSFTDALKWYQRASQTGHAGAKARQGKLIMAGRGGKVSFNKGLALIEDAALMGEPEAEMLLADLQNRGMVKRLPAAEAAPVDAESAAILAEVDDLIQAIGAPMPLGPGLRLGGKPFLAKREANGWIVVLPKPETSGKNDAIWRAASIRLTITKTGDDKRDVRVLLPSTWRHHASSGRETGQLEIGHQSITGLWVPAQYHWGRHNVVLSAIKLSTPEGEGRIEALSSIMETTPGAGGRGIDQTQNLRIKKTEIKGPLGPILAFDQAEASFLLQNFDIEAYRSGAVLKGETASLLSGMSGRLKASGLKLAGQGTAQQDTEIGTLEMGFGAEGLDQPSSRLNASFAASNMTGRQTGSAPSLVPAAALPEFVVAKLSWEKLPLRDLSNQLAAMFLPTHLNPRKQASLGRVMNDAVFDIMNTFADTLIEAGSEIRIEEMSAKGQGWGIGANGAFLPERGKILPFSGKLSITGQGLDQLVKTLDEGASFAAVMLDGLRRTTPPKKDAMGNDQFDVIFGADGAIDINGQRWSQPDAPAKQQGKPVPLTRNKK